MMAAPINRTLNASISLTIDKIKLELSDLDVFKIITQTKIVPSIDPVMRHPCANRKNNGAFFTDD
jgi:hypothetical protein